MIILLGVGHANVSRWVNEVRDPGGETILEIRTALGQINPAAAAEFIRLARVEQQVERRRTDYHWKTAYKLVNSADCIIFEDLNIRGMMARCQPKIDQTQGSIYKV